MADLPAGGGGKGGWHSELVLRAGVGYDFHLAGKSLTPILSVDLIDGGISVVWGIGVGIGF